VASALVILADVYLTLQLSAQAAERAVVRQAEQQAQRIGLHLNHKIAHNDELAEADGDTSVMLETDMGMVVIGMFTDPDGIVLGLVHEGAQQG